jgi:hypothetical protein
MDKAEEGLGVAELGRIKGQHEKGEQRGQDVERGGCLIGGRG